METFDQRVRSAAAAILIRLPWFRGKGRIATAINEGFPATPSSAVACARMRLGYEMAVDLRARTEFLAYYTGEYDTKAIRSILRLVQPDCVILDVGANIGFWSVPLARAVREPGIVHCFEPVPSNFCLLAENVRRNRVERTVRLHQMGLSDCNGNAVISLREDFAEGAETGNAAIAIDGSDSRFQRLEIPIRRLDDLSDSLPLKRLDLVKVDIEGHEDKFLAGAAQTILRFRPTLFMEINEFYYTRRGVDTTALFQDWLLGNSYVAAVQRANRWRLDDFRNRKQGIDDVLFLPRERAQDVMARLDAGC